jgi:hypothetical protein
MKSLKLTARSPQCDAFMEHLNSITWPHPVMKGRVYGQAVIQVYPVADFIYLQLIWSTEKGKGHGSLALRTICMLADHHRVPVVLAPVRTGDEGLMARELRKWYGRHGFNGCGDGRMRREPVTPSQPAPTIPTPVAQGAK